LTDREVRAVKPGVTLDDGGGLELVASSQVDEKGKPVGARSVYRYWTNRIERRMGLGLLSEVSLAQARGKRNEQAAIRGRGIDPIQVRRDEKRLAVEKAKAERAQAEVPRLSSASSSTSSTNTTGRWNEEHLVPLSNAAMRILRMMKEEGAGSKYVFPSPRAHDEPMSDMALLMVLRRVDTGTRDDEGTPIHYDGPTTMHGLARATFSTWAYEETDFKEDVVEVALAHSEANRVRAAYDRRERDSFADQRRQLMEAWATYVMSAWSRPTRKARKVSVRRS